MCRFPPIYVDRRVRQKQPAVSLQSLSTPDLLVALDHDVCAKISKQGSVMSYEEI